MVLKFRVVVMVTVFPLIPVKYTSPCVVTWLLTVEPEVPVVNLPEIPVIVPDGVNVFSPDFDEFPTVTLSVSESPNGTSTGPDAVCCV